MWKGGGNLDGLASPEGWAEIGGGVMLQWGKSDSPIGRNECTTATFRKPFNGIPFSATATQYSANTKTNDALTTQSYTPSSMVICQTGYADGGAVYATYLVVGKM